MLELLHSWIFVFGQNWEGMNWFFNKNCALKFSLKNKSSINKNTFLYFNDHNKIKRSEEKTVQVIL